MLNGPGLPFSLLSAFVFAAALFLPAAAHCQAAGGSMTQEYFVEQAEDEALLVRISAFEAEFESKLTGREGVVLLNSAIEGSRIAPVFQFIDYPKAARQLGIEVTAHRHTARTEFGLGLTRLKVWDQRSQAVARAYSYLSFGMQKSTADDEANWSVKIDSLANAGRLFQQYGMKEMRLWSHYLAAHQVQFRLHDYSIVYAMTREILEELRGTRMQEIELATLQLQAAAMAGLKAAGSLPAPADKPDPLQSLLSRSAALAQSMGYEFERAWALYSSGRDFASGSQYAQALAQFDAAVEIADEIGAAGLAKEIRESSLEVHNLRGDSPATGEVLRELESQLERTGGGDELALNLLEQGRLYASSFLYGPAIDLYTEALGHQNNSAISKQISFEMARAFYASGRPEQALDYLQRAGIDSTTDSDRQINPVFDVAEGLNILAAIYRLKDESANVRRARDSQARRQPADARFLYQRGLDELLLRDGSSQRARSLFEQSYQAAGAAGETDLQRLSLMQYCALAQRGGPCEPGALDDAFAELVRSAQPVNAVQAMFLHAQILAAGGRTNEAAAVMEKLVDEIHFLRFTVPGLLDAWYREWHDAVYEFYLGLMTGSGGGRADATASLLALTRIRSTDRYSDSGHSGGREPTETSLLRNRLAQRARAGPGASQGALEDQINGQLRTMRSSFKKTFAYLSAEGLQRYLHGLGRNECILTYHLGASGARAWVAHRDGVRMIELSAAGGLQAALEDARTGLADTGLGEFDRRMADLGERLLGPVAGLLEATVYWIPAGPLLGLPLDALRLDGHYLVETHNVIALADFPARPKPSARLAVGRSKNLFLAGHPRDYSGGYATSLDTSPEIRAIADMFVGPGLHIVQGAALLPDEFRNDVFRQAALVHLSMPGRVDLRYPGQSVFELSEDEYLPGRQALRAADIRAQDLAAKLAFLSGTTFEQQPHSDFSVRPGLVGDFLEAGAETVIASLWAAGGPAAQALMAGFYRRLDHSGNVAEALRGAKREYLAENRDIGLFDWAAFQLFTR